MEDSVIERIKYIIEQEGETPRSFASTIKFNYSTLNNYLTGRRVTIDSELIRRVILSYDNISAEWLLIGKGPILKSEALEQVSRWPTSSNSSSIMIPFEEYKKSIAEKDEVIKDQAHKIGMLEHELQLFTSKKQTALGMENASTAAEHQMSIPEAE